MQKSRSSMAFGFASLLSTILLAACSAGGGGGGSVSPAPSTPAATQTAASTAPTFCCSAAGPSSMGAATDTKLTGAIAALPAATFGTAAQQTAQPGGPAFDGTAGGYPANVTFPLITTGLQAGPSGLSAATGNQGATLTVVSTSQNLSTYQLVIPSANVNTTATQHEDLVLGIDTPTTGGLSYVVMGEWNTPATNGGGSALQSQMQFVFGYETSASAMPTSGTANFSGTTSAMVFKTVGADILTTNIDGKAAMSVNFGSGQMTGSLTQMQQWNGYSSDAAHPTTYLPWNDVSLNANIAAGSNRFSGSAAAASAPGTTFSLSGSATGHVDGAFYGPAAQNLGAVWSLSDGTASAIGALTAKQ